jgi:hypothetical protein
MKKILLALLVLTIAMPVMGQVTVQIKRHPTDANKAIISYNCSAGEKVRAFALTVNVKTSTSPKGAYIVGSAIRLEPNYYVTPSNIQFAATSGGKTYISSNGSPVVSPSIYPNDANGFILEMASLYAPSDPNHKNPPPSSGNLIQFGMDCSKVTGNFGTVDVSISANAVRGGIVLEDGNSIPIVTFPICTYGPPKLSFCRTTHNCWLCPGQPSGDTDGNGTVDGTDYSNFKKAYGTNSASSPHGTGAGQYNCCCDFDHSGGVNSTDYSIFKTNYGKKGMGTCATKTCP